MPYSAESGNEGEGKRGEQEREERSRALTVGIHERSLPRGLACERTLCPGAFHRAPPYHPLDHPLSPLPYASTYTMTGRLAPRTSLFVAAIFLHPGVKADEARTSLFLPVSRGYSVEAVSEGPEGGRALCTRAKGVGSWQVEKEDTRMYVNQMARRALAHQQTYIATLWYCACMYNSSPPPPTPFTAAPSFS